MKGKLIVLSGFLSLAPVMVFAQGQNNTTSAFLSTCTEQAGGTLGSIICTISDIFKMVMPVVIVLGLVYFVWGVISYVVAGDEEAKTKGRDRMIYGIIGLAVIVAVWGLVNILINTFNLKGDTTHSIPTVNVP